MKKAGDLIKQTALPVPDMATEAKTSSPAVSKRKLKRVEAIEVVRLKREEGKQSIGFSSRPFVLTGLPIRRLPKDVREYTRRNGRFFLSVIGHPEKGIPFGQDRLIPIWVATLALRQNNRVITFDAASELLDTFGLPRDGKTYRRLIEGFERIFWATIAFGTDRDSDGAFVFKRARFNFFDNVELWYTKSVDQRILPGDFQNVIELSHKFWEEIQAHPIPVDLAVVRALADSPGNLDLYVWLVWRCWTAKREVRIPLFGPEGLIHQLGVSERTANREFRRRLKDWLRITRALWPECPAALADDANALIVRPGKAIGAHEKR